MARRIGLQVLRGARSAMPTLGDGELYLATDEAHLYIGTSGGNKLVLASELGVGNGPPNQSVTARKKGTGGGPTTPQTVVGFAKLTLGGSVFWIPLMQ